MNDVRVHRGSTRAISGPSMQTLADPQEQGKFEVNGNYAVNPELVIAFGDLAPDPFVTCSCEYVSQLMEGTKVTVANGEVGRGENEKEPEEANDGCETGVDLSTGHVNSIVSVSDCTSSGKLKGRGGGHCHRSKDKMMTSHAHHPIEDTSQSREEHVCTVPHLLEHSLSYSILEQTSNDILSQFKKSGILSNIHAEVERSCGHQSDQSLISKAGSEEVCNMDTAAVEDGREGAQSSSSQVAASESDSEVCDQTRSGEDDELGPEPIMPNSVPKRPLCLPRPFRFSLRERRLKDTCDMSEGPSSAVGRSGRSRIPPPRQSWLLRLFESKLFDMSIAISYLFNSKEPGVQTYLGRSFGFFLLFVTRFRK